jgi:hypothetical protein
MLDAEGGLQQTLDFNAGTAQVGKALALNRNAGSFAVDDRVEGSAKRDVGV